MSCLNDGAPLCAWRPPDVRPTCSHQALHRHMSCLMDGTSLCAWQPPVVRPPCLLAGCLPALPAPGPVLGECHVSGLKCRCRLWWHCLHMPAKRLRSAGSLTHDMCASHAYVVSAAMLALTAHIAAGLAAFCREDAGSSQSSNAGQSICAVLAAYSQNLTDNALLAHATVASAETEKMVSAACLFMTPSSSDCLKHSRAFLPKMQLIGGGQLCKNMFCPVEMYRGRRPT